jgi:hypothetical protein
MVCKFQLISLSVSIKDKLGKKKKEEEEASHINRRGR